MRDGARAVPLLCSRARLALPGCGPLPAELQRLLATLGELDERIAGVPPRAARAQLCARLRRACARADLRTEARSKFEQCMELPSQAARQSAPESGDQVASLRTEVEDAHKARSRRLFCLPILTVATPSQLIQQLSMEKVHLAATASELVRSRHGEGSWQGVR